MEDFFTADDCYFSNCKATSYDEEIDWGLEPTEDLSACQDAPHDEGSRWEVIGACYNPRLDVDIEYCDTAQTDSTETDFCAPENINVDNPAAGEPYRVAVHYWADHDSGETASPTVNIYCGGALRATFGAGAVTLVNDTNWDERLDDLWWTLDRSASDLWLVADVSFVEVCGEMDCEITPLLRDGEPWVQQGEDFGPPWSN